MSNQATLNKALEDTNRRVAQVTTRIQRLEKQIVDLSTIEPLPVFKSGQSPGDRVRRMQHRLDQLANSMAGPDTSPEANAYRQGAAKEAAELQQLIDKAKNEDKAFAELARQHGEKSLLADALETAKQEYLNLTGTRYEMEN